MPQVARNEISQRVEDFLNSQPLPTALAAKVKAYYGYVSAKPFNDPGDRALVAGEVGRRGQERGQGEGERCVCMGVGGGGGMCPSPTEKSRHHQKARPIAKA